MPFNVATLIGNNIEVYDGNAFVRVKFTATAEQAGTLDNPVVHIDSLNLIDFTSPDESQFSDRDVPLSPDPLNPGQWTGFVDGRVPSGETTVKLSGSASSNGDTGTLEQPEVPVHPSTGLKHNIAIVPVPTMLTAPKNGMKPAEDTDGKYSKHLEIYISYDNNGTDTPYENYLIQWSASINADFTEKFYVYDSEAAVSVLTPQFNRKNMAVYYTSTDDRGIASLYVVASTDMASDTIMATITQTTEKKVTSFTSVNTDINKATYNLPSPDLTWPTDPIVLNDESPRQFRVVLDFDSVIGDQAHLYLNDKYVSTTIASSTGLPLETSIPRSSILSTTDPIQDDSVENYMFYAVAQHGSVKTSLRKVFQAKGPIEPVDPEDVIRTLPAPYLINHSRTINEDMIQNDLAIFISKRNSKKEFVFKTGDQVTGKIYVKGYQSGSNLPKNGVFSAGEFPVKEEDFAEDEPAEYVVAISKESLKGFDSNTRGVAGIAKIEYIVRRPGSVDLLYSELDTVYIDTVPPHGKKKLKDIFIK